MRRAVSPFRLIPALLLLSALPAAYGQTAPPEDAGPAPPEDAGPAPPEDAGPAPRIEARALQGLKAEVAALILAGNEGGELWAAVMAAPFPGGEGKWNVDYWVEIDGGRLLDGAAPGETEEGGEPAGVDSLRVEVHAYAITEQGKLASSSNDWFRVPEELGETLAEGGAKYAGRLEVGPGEYELRILVRERRSERFVLRILPLDVPGPDAGRTALLPPLFADVDGAWIEVRGSAPPVSPFSPSALPVLGAGRPSTARLRISGSDGIAPPVLLRALDKDRQPLAEIEAEIAEASRAPFPELHALEMSFALPDDIQTGNYFLETSLDWDDAVPRTTQIYVLGLERSESEIVWTDLQRLDSLSERRREALDLAEKQRAAKRIALIAEAYRGVLGRLAEGSVNQAVAELVALETEVLEASDSDALLANAEDELISKLADVEAESLIPVLHLHMSAHEHYTGESSGRLDFYTRERVVVAARLYAEKSRGDRAPRLASSIVSDLGASLHGARMWVAARRMMEAALALDEDNATALLGLGLAYERRAEYDAAVGYLERLVELEPRSEEGRLRLALSLRRAGDVAAAARHLRRVVDEAATEWILTVAHQELARILADSGRFNRAARLLEAGLDRLPSEGRLYVQLAYVLDRLGERRKARNMIRRTPAGTPDSPRLRYSRDLGRNRSSEIRPVLARQTMARLAVLGRALSRTEETR